MAGRTNQEHEALEELKVMRATAQAERRARVIDYARKNPGTPIKYYKMRFNVGPVLVRRWLTEAGIDLKTT